MPAPVRSPLRFPPNQKFVTNAALFPELPRTAAINAQAPSPVTSWAVAVK